MPQKKPKGIIRSKTQLLIQSKEARRKKTSRFAKENLPGLNQYYLATMPNQNSLRNPLAIELQKMPTMTTLPPEWVEMYEECLRIIKSIQDIKKQILTEQSRRLSLVKVSEEKESERRIYDLTMTATKKIKQCEKIVEQLQKQASQSKSDERTRKNACVSLAVQIQQLTKELRKQQKAFVEQRQNIQQSTKVSFLELAATKATDPDYQDDMDDDDQLQMELKVNVQRNQQILKIIQSIHQLNQLYHQLNNLVIVQGSLLDRIDENIQESSIKVKEAQEIITKIDDKQRKSKCACIMISVMLTIVVILGIVLIAKWSKH